MAIGTIHPGDIWYDTDGKPIQAHGGGILFDNEVYYWYGENKDAPNVSSPTALLDRVDVIGISCYSSRDLVNWKNEGVILPAVPDDPSHDIHPLQVFERPKVVHCPTTGKYVLWAHADSPDYKKACVGVAIADTPIGPFVYQGSFRPCDQESRDMTIFVDTDGTAYLVYSSQWNATTHIAPLMDDYLSVRGDYVEAFPGEYREAPAVFKYEGRYYMITSGCTGWEPNPARWHVADSMLGPWVTGGDPCVGDEKGTTFDAQSTFVLPFPGATDRFILMADRWQRYNLQDSRYVWLLLRMEEGVPRIEWQDAWTLPQD